MKKKHLLILILAAFMASSIGAFSQQFHLLKVDTNNFPKAKGWFFSHTTAGLLHANLVPADFVVTENGNAVKNLTITQEKLADFPPASVFIAMDASSSLTDIAAGKETKMDWVKYIAKSVLDTLKDTDGTLLQYLCFSSKNYKLSPWFDNWVNDKAPIQKWIDQNEIVYAGATDFKVPFLDAAGIIPQLSLQPIDIPRVALFVSDGAPERTFPRTTIEQIIKDCKKYKITVYCINITAESDPDIREICTESGGKVWSCYTKEEIRVAVREFFGGFAQNKTVNYLNWDTDISCDEASRTRKVFAKFVRIPDSSDYTYKAPAPPYVTANVNQFIFGKVGTGKNTGDLTLTANGADFEITKVNLTPNDKIFTLNLGGALPLKIQKGKSITIKVTYSETNPTQTTTSTLAFESKPCNMPSVEIIAPCLGVAAQSLTFPTIENNKQKDTTFNCVFKNLTPIQVSGTAVLSGTDASEFSIVTGSNFTLSENDCVNLKIRFTPKTVGKKSATITINLPAEFGNYTVPLTGEALKPAEGVEEDLAAMGISMSANQPNPVSNSTTIVLNSMSQMPISLNVYNMLGENVASLLNNQAVYGTLPIVWNASELPDGVYFYKLQVNGLTLSKSMIIAR